MTVIGKEIISKVSGKKGIITDVNNGSIYVRFESSGSIPIRLEKVKDVIDCDDELTSYIGEVINGRRSPKIAKSSSKKNNSQIKKYFFKFEGKASSGDIIQDINSVEEEGKRFYLLNFKNRPSLSYGDEFFIVKSYTDRFNQGQASIFGKGIVEGFEESNYYKEEWLMQHPWLPVHPYYVIVKECRFLNTQLSNGILLSDLVDRIGSDLYESTEGKEIDTYKLYTYHNRRSHMYISEKTFRYISEIFEEKTLRYGTTNFNK